MKRTYIHIALFVIAATATATADAAKPGWAGMDWSDTTLRYGRWECRMRLSYAPNCVECFYLMDNEPDEKKHWEEVDMEVVGKNMQGPETFIHCFTNTAPYYGRKHAFPYKLDAGYHTYALEWTPTYVAWELDGKVYRKAEETSAGKLRDQSFATGNSATDIKDTTYSRNWIKQLRDSANMELQIRFWAGGTNLNSWLGEWTDDNCGKAMFLSWYKAYSYTPGQGPNGSDFTLKGYDDFTGTAIDTTKWLIFSWAFKDVVVKEGKCIMVMNCDTVDGFAGMIPMDPGDTLKIQPVPVLGPGKNIGLETSRYVNGVVSYTIAAPGRVTLSLYDLRGRLFLKIADADMVAGTHTIRCPLRMLPIGSFVTVLQTPSYRALWNVARPMR